jgi:hypothetical protein
MRETTAEFLSERKIGISIFLFSSAVLIGGLSFGISSVFSQEALSKSQDSRVAEKHIYPDLGDWRSQMKVVYLDRFGEARQSLIESQKEFLEINFTKDIVRKYEDGRVATEFPILAKGDPQDWGGSPAGLYKNIQKYKDRFSSVANVHMPYAIRFYGKYFLHGETFYSSGEKTLGAVSGGCIRLEDHNAEEVYSSVGKDLPILVIDKENDDYRYNVVEPLGKPSVSAISYIVADLDSGFVFAKEESTTKHPIASLTKLMTAVVVAENADLRSDIRVRPEMLEAYGTTNGLEEGKRFRVVELFYPLLVESSNDAAEVLAGFFGRDNTMRFMNEKAKAIFMRDTTFVDPSGFDPGNISTAEDLFYLARYVRNNRSPLFQITKGEYVQSFGSVRFEREKMWSKNIFVTDTSFEGGKTGFIKVSKDTGIFLFRFVASDEEVRTVAFIVLGSDNSKLDVQKLYAWAQKRFGLTPDYAKEPSIVSVEL